MKKIFKWLFIALGSVVLAAAIVASLFLNLSPQFGGSATDAQKATYAATGHYANGIFTNAEEIDMALDCHSITQMTKEMFQPDPNVAPKQDIPVVPLAPETITSKPDSITRITWFGHSSFLIEVAGKNILLDPVFGQYAAPHPWLGRKRYNSQMPISLEDMPPIDAIIISHDHYDHLDYPSIEVLKGKTDHFFVPLGVGNHLRSWDIPEARIHEMDWWQENNLEDLKIILTPSRHMSGRGLTDQSSTLWGSWIIQSEDKNIYFSGDGGYGKHFKAIGDKYGPFDIGLMECGQYNKLWADVHLMPEQTVQATLDVKAEMMVPIHWGSFTLATHSWTDPVERSSKKAAELNVPFISPQIGESIVLGDSIYPQTHWWEGIAQTESETAPVAVFGMAR